MMPEVLPVVEIVCLLVVIGFQIVLFFRENGADLTPVREIVDGVDRSYERTERAVREEIAKNRDETSNAARQSREETAATLKSFNESLVTGQRRDFSGLVERRDKLTESNETRMERVRETVKQKLKTIQEDNAKSLEQMRQRPGGESGHLRL